MSLGFLQCFAQDWFCVQVDANLTIYSYTGDLLRDARDLESFNRPTSREHRSVWNWLRNCQPVFGAEQEFIACKEDLITLRSGREHAWLDSMIEMLIYHLRCAPLNVCFLSLPMPLAPSLTSLTTCPVDFPIQGKQTHPTLCIPFPEDLHPLSNFIQSLLSSPTTHAVEE